MRNYRFDERYKKILKAMDKAKGTDETRRFTLHGCYQGGLFLTTDCHRMIVIDSQELKSALGKEDGYFIIDSKNCIITEVDMKDSMPKFKRLMPDESKLTDYIYPIFKDMKINAGSKDMLLYLSVCNTSKMIFNPSFFDGIGELFYGCSKLVVGDNRVSIVTDFDKDVKLSFLAMSMMNDYFFRLK